MIFSQRRSGLMFVNIISTCIFSQWIHCVCNFRWPNSTTDSRIPECTVISISWVWSHEPGAREFVKRGWTDFPDLHKSSSSGNAQSHLLLAIVFLSILVHNVQESSLVLCFSQGCNAWRANSLVCQVWIWDQQATNIPCDWSALQALQDNKIEFDKMIPLRCRTYHSLPMAFSILTPLRINLFPAVLAAVALVGSRGSVLRYLNRGWSN